MTRTYQVWNISQMGYVSGDKARPLPVDRLTRWAYPVDNARRCFGRSAQRAAVGPRALFRSPRRAHRQEVGRGGDAQGVGQTQRLPAWSSLDRRQAPEASRRTLGSRRPSTPSHDPYEGSYGARGEALPSPHCLPLTQGSALGKPFGWWVRTLQPLTSGAGGVRPLRSRSRSLRPRPRRLWPALARCRLGTPIHHRPG